LRPKAPERSDTIVKVKGPRAERGLLASLNPFSDTPERGEDVTEAESDAQSGAVSTPGSDAPNAEQSDETQARRQEIESVVTPTGDGSEREPEPLAPVTAVDSEADKAGIPSGEQAALAAPPAPQTTDAAAEPAADEPSWWERVKQGVGVSDDSAQTPPDSPASEQVESDESGAQRTAVIEPQAAPDNPVPASEASVASEQEPTPPAATAASAEPAVASDESAGEPASTDGDGGFFDRIRDRFKIPELPPLPTVKPPDDFNPDVGDP